MVPTMLLVGLLTRRLWAIPVGAAAWGLVLLATGVIGLDQWPLSMVVGGANTAVGVLVHRLVAWPLHRARSVRPRAVS